MTSFARLSPLLALRLVFAANGAGIGIWFPRIPDVKAAIQADLFVLSMCFFMLPLGTMLGFGLAQKFLNRYGPRAVCLWGGPVFIAAMLLPAFAGAPVQLGAALFAVGLTIASIEVAMNTKAGDYERETGRRIMTGCHAYWSFGGMAGALTAGAFAQAGASFLLQQLVLVPTLAVLAHFVARRLSPDPTRAKIAERPMFALPPAALVGLCVLPMGALMLEGAMMEWSAIFLRENLQISPFATAATYSGFAVAMAVARLQGDRLAERYGPRRIIGSSALIATAAILLFATAGSVTVAAPSAVLLGLGIANIYPLAVSLAAAAPGGSSQSNIAAVAFSAFTVFLLGPPLIGTLGSWLGLPVALALLAPAGIYPLLMGRVAEHPTLPVEEV